MRSNVGRESVGAVGFSLLGFLRLRGEIVEARTSEGRGRKIVDDDGWRRRGGE
jgi:hypothetical protein